MKTYKINKDGSLTPMEEYLKRRFRFAQTSPSNSYKINVKTDICYKIKDDGTGVDIKIGKAKIIGADGSVSKHDHLGCNEGNILLKLFKICEGQNVDFQLTGDSEKKDDGFFDNPDIDPTDKKGPTEPPPPPETGVPRSNQIKQILEQQGPQQVKAY